MDTRSRLDISRLTETDIATMRAALVAEWARIDRQASLPHGYTVHPWELDRVALAAIGCVRADMRSAELDTVRAISELSLIERVS